MRFPRASGLLLHPTSLPGPYGVGDLGAPAFEFLEAIAAAGQRVWQVLPLGPTGFGDSPYQLFSAFAGNPLLISLDRLVDDGLLAAADAGDPRAFRDGQVDFAAVSAHRGALWPRLEERFDRLAPPRVRDQFDRFCADEASWLTDYALFMAVKGAHRQVAWIEWEADIAARTPAAVERWTKQLAGEVRQHQLTQFLFFEQWRRLRAHANARGIAILGDLPIFVAHDSADVWARRDLFRLDDRGRPAVVAGVPPDYFSVTGQLWGNPHYDWEALASSGYAWWIARVQAALRLVDRIRLDHFRGFVAAWEIKGSAATAQDGAWQPGPGAALFDAIQAAFGEAPLPFVAENLGVITPEVEALRHRYDFPGMAILQFAFGTDPQAHDFRPHNYPRNLVVYTGTHDNDTTVGWWTSGAGHSTRSGDDIAREQDYARRYLRTDDEAVQWAFIRAALASVADTAIVPVQDVLGLGSDARMNQPGTGSGNWRWRLTPGQLNADVLERLASLTETYER